MVKLTLSFLSFLVLLAACNSKKDTLFEELSEEQTGIDFVNRSLEKTDFNIFNYRNFYNGGGVAIGDVNNDNLPDIFVTSNFEENKLYLNKGDMKFEDITTSAGLTNKKFWSTGATFADVNGDGFLDIYVCNSGSRDGRGNQLYLNKALKGQTPQFEEIAEKAGLVDGGFSTHAAFFDYDRDGDLDMYLLNNSFTPIDKLGYTNLRQQRDKLGGDKLFRNDSGENNDVKFTDVSEEAGIYGSLIGFGLGITIGDINNDNWPDIYISNDFYERDYLYVNQKNGTFKEDLESQMKHISLSSMGADIADINNDGNLDIFVTDMLPGDDRRLKTTSIFEGYNLNELKVKKGFYHQFMRNNLHLNNGDGSFSEIGQYSGVHATDWSWGALLFDMDGDGFKDIFVANGIAKDLTDQDFVEFLGDKGNMQAMRDGKKFIAKEFIDKISSKPIPNFAYQNLGNLKFENKVNDWGLAGPGFSNGSAYGDLDNDGDLDLVVNNINAPLSVFKNTTIEKNGTHYLKISLIGYGKNLNGIGAKVMVYQKGKTQLLQQMPNRGFQSSSDLNLVFGLGKDPIIDSLSVIWPDDQQQTILKPKSDQSFLLRYSAANRKWLPNVDKQIQPLFKDVTDNTINYKHIESIFIDYDRDVLLKQKYSTEGPAMAVGDVNNDGLDDIYFGSAAGFPKQLYIQQKNGKFVIKPQKDFLFDNTTENTDAIFFDADGDSDLDLFVVTGSNEFLPDAAELHDVLYLNDGQGNFQRDLNFPVINENGSCVAAADFDKDGDIDLFVGSRMLSGSYGINPPSNLYINDGKGGFKNQSKRYMPEIVNLGMITDAVWADVDGDGYQELILTQDWGEIIICQNDKGKQLKTLKPIPNSSGLWNTITAADIDKDGDIDFIAGNIGENTKLKVSKEFPGILNIGDFDNNGSLEQIISCVTEDGKTYPMVLKGELQRAVPMIKQRFVKYTDYANKTITELFGEEVIKKSIEKRITTTQSVLLINNGKGEIEMKALPEIVQFSQIRSIIAEDFNNDNILDILLTGNFFDVLPEWGRFDTNSGILLQGKGKGDFEVVSSSATGLKLNGQIRVAKTVRTPNNGKSVIFAKNNDYAQYFDIKN